MNIETLVVRKVKTAPGTLKSVKPPSMYQVVLLNDDYTPMEFVVDVLMDVFHLNLDKATRVMMQVHYEGFGICGVYPRDVAETKAARVVEKARQAGHPLMCNVALLP
jgi:ATP-dependent Clp protease adaptor protein ClpS